MQGRQYAAPSAGFIKSAADTTQSRLQTDTSTDTIFYAVWAGALTYAFAREGLEFSKVTSAALAGITGTTVYSQWWRLAVNAAAQLTGLTGILPARTFATRK